MGTYNNNLLSYFLYLHFLENKKGRGSQDKLQSYKVRRGVKTPSTKSTNNSQLFFFKRHTSHSILEDLQIQYHPPL